MSGPPESPARHYDMLLAARRQDQAMTFAGVLLQRSCADPTAGVGVLQLFFAFVLLDDSEMLRHL